MDNYQKFISICFITLVILSSVLINSSSPFSDKKSSNVSEVVDGDTLTVETSKGFKDIRIIGVDTPETVKENNPLLFDLGDNRQNEDCLDSLGKNASRYVKNLAENESVKLKKDPLEGPEDSYGRSLRYVKFNGSSLGYRLVEKGLARVYRTDFKNKKIYSELEAEAKAEGKGVWGC